MRDNLPKKIKPEECGIVNLDSRRGKGTHWTAYQKCGTDVIYFDSYGNLGPPQELIKYFLSDGSKKDIKYNYDIVQQFNSYKCGHYCLQFLYKYCNNNNKTSFNNKP